MAVDCRSLCSRSRGQGKTLFGAADRQLLRRQSKQPNSKAALARKKASGLSSTVPPFRSSQARPPRESFLAHHSLRTRLHHLSHFSSKKIQLSEQLGVFKSSRIQAQARIEVPNREWEAAFEKACDDSDLPKALRLLESLRPSQNGKPSSPKTGPQTIEVDVGPRLEAERPITEVQANLGQQPDLGATVLVQEPKFDDVTFSLPQEREETFSSVQQPTVHPSLLLRVLDTCLAATDLFSVAAVYKWLQEVGLLKAFGKVKLSDADTSRLVTPEGFKKESGLEATKLSPKKQGIQGPSAVAVVLLIGSLSFGNINELTFVRPLLTTALTLGLVDSFWLGGAGFGQLMMLWPGYRRRVLIHEAGHVLAAYLLGCPVRGVVLDAVQAVRLGIRGQAGTQFWDQKLEEEMKANRLSASTLNRYFVVLFAGIAAEALIYGEAEGGESDERLYVHVVKTLRPPWSPAKISNQARWAVLQAYKLLLSNERVLTAVVRRLERGASMADLAQVIEETAERGGGPVRRTNL